MWKAFFNLFGQLLTLARHTDRNRTEIEKLREEFDNMTLIMHGLANEVRRAAEREAHEREKLALRLENELLKSKRRLPVGRHKTLPNGGA